MHQPLGLDVFVAGLLGVGISRVKLQVEVAMVILPANLVRQGFTLEDHNFSQIDFYTSLEPPANGHKHTETPWQ